MLTLCLAIGALPLGAVTAIAVSPDIVISQVYGAGGNTGATLRNDYVELFNRGATTVSVTGWSIQYASASGTGNFGATTTQITELSGLIAPGQYFLIYESGGANGSPLPPADQTDPSPIAMAAGAGKVALVRTTAPLGCNGGSTPCSAAQLALIVDLVGYGPANFYEGSGSTDGIGTTTSASRRNGGCTDTDQNNADFTVGAPNPRNTSSPIASCPVDPAPSVGVTSPANGESGVAADAPVVITFTEPVNISGAWYGIACAASGAHTATVTSAGAIYTLDPDVDFSASESCTVTVMASQVRDQDAIDPPDNMTGNHVFTFTVEGPPTLIREIQGASHISPKVSQTVSNVRGVVTALRSNGFWMQDTAPDSNDATSEGIFVFTTSAPTATLQPGITVKVSGRVTEFRGSRSGDLTLTEITTPSITITGVATIPTPVILGAGGRRPPVTVIENDSAGNVETSNSFDPVEDGIDFYESLEGMLVAVESAVAVSRTTRFGSDQSGEIWVLGDGGAAATTRSARGAVVISPGDFNPERILVDDEIFKSVTTRMPDVNVGAVFGATLTGPLDYAFSNYRIQLLADPVIAADALTREITEPATKNELSVATFNVENLDANDPQSKFDELARLIVTNLQAPDIIGLEEVQDDNGPINDATVTADATIARLIDAIVVAGGPTYAWRSIDPEDDQDGGEPGGNIRVGFIYRTDGYVEFIERPGATATTANSVLGQHSSTRLAYSPGRIAPTDPAWAATRKPVAAEFKFRGEQIFIVVNHFSSKGGDDALYGWRQPPVFGSEVKRIQQAQAVNAFVGEIVAADPKANVIVLGDINDFQFSPVMNALRGDDLNVLIDTLPVGERYSYVFDGNGQALDHILISDALFAQPFEYDIVHVNAEFSDQASDHDPQLVRLGIKGTAKNE